MRRRLAVFAFLVATSAGAQQHPHLTKGFDPGKVFHFTGLDHINTFNGNLVITLPLGQPYAVDADLAYRFRLIYNGLPWSAFATEDGTMAEAVPDVDSNVGVGWLVSLGRLHPPPDGQTPSAQRYVYEDPTGRKIRFLPESTGTYIAPEHASEVLRLRRVDASERHIEFGSGEIHVFKKGTGVGCAEAWRLSEMKDRFGNKVGVSYSCTTGQETWMVQQYRNNTVVRTQTLVFLKRTDVSPVQPTLDRIDLTAFGGKTLRYKFYTVLRTLKTPVWDNSAPGNLHRETRNGYLLTHIEAQDATATGTPVLETWQFQYEGDTGTPYSAEEARGYLRALELPTGGFIEWEWADRAFPPGSQSIGALQPITNPRLTQSIITKRGIAVRSLLTANRGIIGRWNYHHVFSGDWCVYTIPDPQDPTKQIDIEVSMRQLVGAVEEPPNNGTRTSRITYYSTYADTTGGCGSGGWTHHEYGMPFTRWVADESKFLSEEVLMGVTSYATTQNEPRVRPEGAALLRSTFKSFGLTFQGVDLETERRDYFDDDPDGCGTGIKCYTEERRLAFDAYGNFKQISRGSNLVGSPARTTFTNYLPPLSDTAWITTLYDERCLADESALRTSPVSGCSALAERVAEEFCFDRSTGFLQRHRRLGDSSDRTKDVVTDFVSEQLTSGSTGNAASEICMAATKGRLHRWSAIRSALLRFSTSSRMNMTAAYGSRARTAVRRIRISTSRSTRARASFRSRAIRTAQ